MLAHRLEYRLKVLDVGFQGGLCLLIYPEGTIEWRAGHPEHDEQLDFIVERNPVASGIS
jgi:hypothetical protein